MMQKMFLAYQTGTALTRTVWIQFSEANPIGVFRNHSLGFRDHQSLTHFVSANVQSMVALFFAEAAATVGTLQRFRFTLTLHSLIIMGTPYGIVFGIGDDCILGIGDSLQENAIGHQRLPTLTTASPNGRHIHIYTHGTRPPRVPCGTPMPTSVGFQEHSFYQWVDSPK